ncbi:head-tail connector protein [Staphylococcus simulans]|uniref:head-tail connector protein n=1 Tax=Staphylococcus simulans TaxID=1286 RepID=UPI000D1D1E42|nr:head-tail connector protein [Staphylococcus simulans]PTJ25037.1 phage gp6-like head-tail connector protein [Staphylococcus simulans]PTJ92066.1 phage gp6-like head-tail connector protein [Staphylococcus simulans]
MHLDSIKLWLKVDYGYEDSLINELIESAISELKLSGVPEYEEGAAEYPLYKTAIKYIIARDFESRGYVGDGSKSKSFNDKALKNLILKLKEW